MPRPKHEPKEISTLDNRIRYLQSALIPKWKQQASEVSTALQTEAGEDKKAKLQTLHQTVMQQIEQWEQEVDEKRRLLLNKRKAHIQGRFRDDSGNSGTIQGIQGRFREFRDDSGIQGRFSGKSVGSQWEASDSRPCGSSR